MNLNDAVQVFAQKIIAAEPWRGNTSSRLYRDPFGTAVLNYVYDHAWDDTFVAAFEAVRESPHMAAWALSCSTDSTYGGPSMLHDLVKAKENEESGVYLANVLHMAFAQYMVGVVQVALADRIMVLDQGKVPIYEPRTKDSDCPRCGGSGQDGSRGACTKLDEKDGFRPYHA